MTRRRRQLQNTAENLRDAGVLDNVTHFEPRRETVGDLLRRAREGKGRELSDVATTLRIRIGYLKAIEDGRFQDLPGLTYAVGFVRTYADHLGLDAEEVVRRFRDEVAELKSQTQLIFPVVAAEGKIPRGAVLLLSAVLAAIAYGGWYYLSEREQSALDLIPALPERLQALISGETTEPADVAPGATAPAASAPETTPAPAAESMAPDTAAPPVSGQVAAVPSADAPPVAPAPAAPAPEAPVAAAPPIVPAPDAATVAPLPATPAPTLPAPGQTVDPVAESAASASALPDAEGAAPALPEVSASEPAASESAASEPSTLDPNAPDPDAPALAAPADSGPTLDSAGLPSVAAPSAPPTTTLPGVASTAEAPTLPPQAEGQAFGATEGGSRIVLVARLESWIQVTDPETNALLTRVLRAGDRYYVPDEGGLSLATGNAGGLDIWVDGRKAPTLGPVGVVRRGIALDPARLESGTALPE